MTDDMSMDRFDDEEAAYFFEGEERLAELKKARRCSDPDLREAAVAHILEEFVLAGAKLADEILAAVDAGEESLSEEAREACLEAIELAVDRPDWYEPGNRIVVGEEEES